MHDLHHMMKLYITPGSPYARMARIVVLEKGLESRVETIAAKTRVAEQSLLQDQSVWPGSVSHT